MEKYRKATSCPICRLYFVCFTMRLKSNGKKHWMRSKESIPGGNKQLKGSSSCNSGNLLRLCFRLSESILTHTHKCTCAQTYIHTHTRAHTGLECTFTDKEKHQALTMAALTALHFNCRDKDSGLSITINDHIIFYATESQINISI